MGYPSAMTDRPATRLYLPGGLAAGGEAALDADQAHRLRTVLRLTPGAAVAAFNLRDGEYLCRIVELTRGGGRLTAVELRRPPAPEPDLWLVFAPIKRARLDWLIEKATELGVAALLPVWTRRTQPERLNRDRLAAHAVAAAEQSERLSVPDIREAQPLDGLVAAWPVER
ncbi:MAG: RsmE family RNA methyltransferase, partial [Stellaceae bacterium]